MTNPQVESLFEHDSFLRAMARRLLGDHGAADDVVQEAWLVALRSAKRPEEVRAGWLAGIVKNLVRRRRRDGERRARRERTAARNGAVVATDEACAERALRRRIAELVVELPEIYKEPLLLRYYDGLSPQAIADRLELPGSTVRTRIQRGLARVRTRLERNGNGHALSVALLAIAAPRPSRGLLRAAGIAALVAATALLARAPSTGLVHTTEGERADARAELAARFAPGGDGVLVPGGSAGGGPTTGVPLVLQGIVHLPEGAVQREVSLDLDDGHPELVLGDTPFAIDVSRFVRGGIVRVRASHPESEPQETVAHVPGRIDLVLRRRALVPEDEFLPERTPEDGMGVPGDGGAGALGGSGLTRGEQTGIALEGVVRLPPGASPSPVIVEAWRPGGTRVKTYARAGARFSLGVASLLADPLPEELRIRASHPDAAPREVSALVRFDPATGAPVLPFLEIELFAAAYLDGVVEIAGVGPVADATVAVFPEGATELVAAARTGPDGTFRVAVDRGGAYFVVAAAPAHAPAGIAVEATQNATIPTLVLQDGVAIEGSVRSAGAPAARATVRASLPENAGQVLSLGLDGGALVADAAGVSWQSVAVETDADGMFTIPGLAARSYRVEVDALLDGDAPPYGAIEVTAPGLAEFDAPVARVEVVVFGDGVPVDRADVQVHRQDGSSVLLETDKLGRAILLARPGEALHIAVAASGYEPEDRDLRASTSQFVFNLKYKERLGTLSVLFRSEDGVPLPPVCDFEIAPDLGSPFQRRVTVSEGRFALTDLEPDGYRITASLPGSFLPTSARVTLARSETVSLALDVRAAGKIVVQFVGEGALPDVWIEGAIDFKASTASTAAAEWRTVADTKESGMILPGHYVLHVLVPDLPPLAFPVDVVAGETTRLLVPLP